MKLVSKIQNRFRTRLFILVSVLLILSMSIISAFLLADIKGVMSREFREKGIIIAREFSQKTAEGIIIEDKEILDRFISQLFQVKDVHYVYVYNRAGMVLTEKVFHEDNLPPIEKPEHLEIDEITVDPVKYDEIKPHSILDIRMPVFFEKENIGYIRLGISLERIGEEVNSRVLNSSILVLALIFAGLIICYFFSRSISMPISKLLEGIKRIGQGDLSFQIKIRNKDELGELAEAINQMSRRLGESDEKLKRYAQELEDKVKERTSELKLINRQLEEDIIQRKNIESALRESKERYKMLFNHLPAGVIHYDEKGAILNLNSRYAQIMGASKEKIIGSDVLYNIGDKKFTEAFQESLNGGVGYFEDEYISACSGEKLFLKVIFHGMTNEEGCFSGGIGLFEDNTGRRKIEEEKQELQEQLQRSQKMELIGTLAGGVAHDLNNILSGLVTYPDLLLMDYPDDQQLRKSISIIQKSGQKAAAIVQDLLTLARQGVAVPEALNLNEIIADFMASPEFFSIEQYHPHVSFEVDADPTLLNIEGSSVHLYKCIMNLISNAAEAMPDGGTVTLSSSNQYLDKPVKGYDDITKGDYAVLSVTDNGIGMSSEEIARIFEPFYTKKVMGRSGTGLGMTVVWGIVKDHKGYIDIHSSKGAGTRFDLYFPSTSKELNKHEVSVPLDQIKGNETVLVVDDVKEQRMIVSLILQKLGYSVVTLASGEDAVEYLRDHSVDLLILDMIMDPGIDGLETYKRIIELHPGQKAIIASGFSENDRVREAQNMGITAYVKKPYSLENIGLAIRAELGA